MLETLRSRVLRPFLRPKIDHFCRGPGESTQTPIFVVFRGFETLRSAVWRPFRQKKKKPAERRPVLAYVDLWVAKKKRLKRRFERFICYLWLFCHELAQKCSKPRFCRYFAKVGFIYGHLWRKNLVISRDWATLCKMPFAWTGLEGLPSAPKRKGLKPEFGRYFAKVCFHMWLLWVPCHTCL